MCWVYLETHELDRWVYTVGFYSPDGVWHSVSDHSNEADAQSLVNYLNGGAT